MGCIPSNISPGLALAQSPCRYQSQTPECRPLPRLQGLILGSPSSLHPAINGVRGTGGQGSAAGRDVAQLARRGWWGGWDAGAGRTPNCHSP